MNPWLRTLFLFLISLVLLVMVGSLAVKEGRQGYFTPRPALSPKSSLPPSEIRPISWEVTEYLRDLEVPWDLVFTPEGELLITERAGTLKTRLATGEIKIIASLPQVYSRGESGLTGIALHPDFSQNHFLYLYYSYREKNRLLNRVSRFRYRDLTLTDEQVILNALPGGTIHNGGRLRFGPDRKLWILSGDAGKGHLAQDPGSLAGKVLRLNDDGSIPTDNPNQGSAVYSFGHRNPQGLDWHPESGQLLVIAHGEQAYDELNLVTADSNHGWPIDQQCVSSQREFVPPILCSRTETWAPSDLTFYGSRPPALKNSLFFAGLRSGMLERVEIQNGQVTARETLIKGAYGRLRAVEVGPDGALYLTTSNRDGRGTPQSGDDKVLKVTPQLF